MARQDSWLHSEMDTTTTEEVARVSARICAQAVSGGSNQEAQELLWKESMDAEEESKRKLDEA